MLRYIDESDAVEAYESLLDEDGPVTVAGIQFYPSEILRELDPTAYRCGMNDYLDSMDLTTDADEADPEEDEDAYDESMDGDHDSAMASAGYGTDEDYGSYGNEE